MESKYNILDLSDIRRNVYKRRMEINSIIIDIQLNTEVIDWFLYQNIDLHFEIDTPDNIKDDRESLEYILPEPNFISEDGFIRILNGEIPYIVFDNTETMNIFLLTWR